MWIAPIGVGKSTSRFHQPVCVLARSASGKETSSFRRVFMRRHVSRYFLCFTLTTIIAITSNQSPTSGPAHLQPSRRCNEEMEGGSRKTSYAQTSFDFTCLTNEHMQSLDWKCSIELSSWQVDKQLKNEAKWLKDYHLACLKRSWLFEGEIGGERLAISLQDSNESKLFDAKLRGAWT